jgi:hypothetical protein
MPEYAGFSPRPRPQQIAYFKTKGDALAVSKGLDRDRAVDESGNQIAVFGRRGARPLRLEETMKMLRTNDGTGDFFKVSDEPKKTSAKNAKPETSWFLSRFFNLILPLGGFLFGISLIFARIKTKSQKHQQQIS